VNISLHETSKLLKGNQTYSQLGFSMLLTRLRNQYAQDDSEENLIRCAEEINAFLGKFVKIMAKDLEKIMKLVETEVKNQVLTFDETCQLISQGKVMHIAGSEKLLRKLPQGNWIGGSTEYFMTDIGGIITSDRLFVTEYCFDDFKIKTYDISEIQNVANDAFENGFSLLLIPFDSELHVSYAKNAHSFENIFLRNISGWITGINPNSNDQVPITVNGLSHKVFTDNAVVLHLKIPDEQTVEINIINTFEQDTTSPIIEFTKEGFLVEKCLINGVETVFADYLINNKIDTTHPLVGDYHGHGINISFREIKDGLVHLYVPVFEGVKYRIAKPVADYSKTFNDRIQEISVDKVIFSCNCLLNFIHGELEGKETKGFVGPITFGEIAYQLVSQTLVYITLHG